MEENSVLSTLHSINPRCHIPLNSQFGNILKSKIKAEINELTRAIELYSNGKKTCNPLTLDASPFRFAN